MGEKLDRSKALLLASEREKKKRAEEIFERRLQDAKKIHELNKEAKSHGTKIQSLLEQQMASVANRYSNSSSPIMEAASKQRRDSENSGTDKRKSILLGLDKRTNRISEKNKFLLKEEINREPSENGEVTENVNSGGKPAALRTKRLTTSEEETRNDTYNSSSRRDLRGNSESSGTSKRKEPLLDSNSGTAQENQTSGKLVAAKKRVSEIVLDEDQTTALSGLLSNRYGCLIGDPGTGKTTLIKFLLKELIKNCRVIDLNACRTRSQSTPYHEWMPSIAIVGFTGRSTQVIRSHIEDWLYPSVGTIHYKLGYYPVDYMTDEGTNSRKFVPFWTADNQLDYDVVVMDEAGMTPIELHNNLMLALKSSCRVYIIGDINQLPPVIGKSILGYAALQWPTYQLTKLHRNAGIIAKNAYKIRHGEQPETDNDFFLMYELPKDDFNAQMLVGKTVNAFTKKGIFDIEKDCIITAQNVGRLGQINMNQRLVQQFNKGAVRTIIDSGIMKQTFAVGDKIMNQKNDSVLGIYNGSIGFIESIELNEMYEHQQMYEQTKTAGGAHIETVEELFSDDHEVFNKTETDEEEGITQRQCSHKITVSFPVEGVKKVYTTSGEMNSLILAYAVTCFKAQGGEYDTVFVICHSSMSRMLSREWLNTAVTRARKRVVLLYDKKGLKTACFRQKIHGNTLQEKARNFLEASKDDDTYKIKPILPEPVQEDLIAFRHSNEKRGRIYDQEGS